MVECKHYERDEINLILDGNTEPVVKCRVCGEYINTILVVTKDTKEKINKIKEDKFRYMVLVSSGKYTSKPKNDDEVIQGLLDIAGTEGYIGD